jgi:hypothetical protein
MTFGALRRIVTIFFKSYVAQYTVVANHLHTIHQRSAVTRCNGWCLMCREPRRFIVSRDTLHFRQRTPTAGHPYDRLSIPIPGELYNTPLSLLRRTVWSTSFWFFTPTFLPLYIHLLQGVSRPLLSSLTSIFSQGSSAYVRIDPNFSANDRRTLRAMRILFPVSRGTCINCLPRLTA